MVTRCRASCRPGRSIRWVRGRCAGCVRMFPEDIEFLFRHIRVDTPVRIINAPVKIGWDGEVLVAEIHPLLETPQPLVEQSLQHVEEMDADIEVPEVVTPSKEPLTQVTEQFITATSERAGQLDWDLVERLVERSNGIPEPVGQSIKNAAASAASQ